MVEKNLPNTSCNNEKYLEPTTDKIESLLKLLIPYISSFYEKGVKVKTIKFLKNNKINKDSVIGSGHKFLSKVHDKKEDENALKIVKEFYSQPFPSEPNSDFQQLFDNMFKLWVPNSINKYL